MRSHRRPAGHDPAFAAPAQERQQGPASETQSTVEGEWARSGLEIPELFARQHDPWPAENVKDFSLVSPSAEVAGVLDQSRADRFVGTDRTAGAALDPQVLTARKCGFAERHAIPLQVVIPATCPARRTCPVPIHLCNLRWIRSRPLWGKNH